MTSVLARRGLVGIFVALSVFASRAAQTPSGTPFVGRWQIALQSERSGPASAAPANTLAEFIVDITPSANGLSAKFVDVARSLLSLNRIREVVAKDGELTLDIEAVPFGQSATTVLFKGRRVGDRLEGTAAPERESETLPWTGTLTTKSSLMAAAPANDPVTEQSAYSAALMKAPAMRAEALKKFLRDFPDSAVKDQATFQLAASYQDVADRQNALRSFIKDFPASFLKDQAAYQLAMSEPNVDDRVAAARRFATEYPSSPYRESAVYFVATTLPPGAERDAAQEEFVRAYPASANAAAVYRTRWNQLLDQTPIDEAKLGAAIDGFISATPNTFIPRERNTTDNVRAQAMNTVADRLMAKAVMLQKALEVIEQAIATAGPSATPRSRAILTTTLGEVLYKMKDTARAERELKHAIDLAGPEGDGEAWLFLGKIAEERHDDAAAIDDYMKAAAEGAPLDTKPALETLYLKVYGSLTTLDEKLDAIFHARPKPFDAGHFVRSGPTVTAPARVVLAELFTGAECAPCIAADMAVDGVGDRYDHDTLAVLVYHLHVPGPDPMTNPDAEARGKYYGVAGTPTLLIDGLAPSSGGGPASVAGRIFSEATKRIELRLEKVPAARLTNFQAAIDDHTIRLTGDAELVAGANSSEKARLHLALVQNVVHYTGTNGVRLHTFVVRALIGSTDGTPLVRPGARIHVDEHVDVAAVAKKLDDYLKGYESTVKPAGFSFGDRVDALDAKHLSIVAFVQDEKTKEVLQALLISPGR